MAWAQEQWEPFVSILRHGFAAKDRLTEAEENVYAVLLDKIDPSDAVQALTEMVLAGRALRPKPGEIVATIRRDPAVPTFEEFCALVFGPKGLLTLQPPPRGRWLGDEKANAVRELVNARLEQMHPLVGAFVARVGLGKLRQLPVEASSFVGESGSWENEAKWALKELRESWDRHVEASDGREVAVRSGRGGLHSHNPLDVLGTPVRPELEP